MYCYGQAAEWTMMETNLVIRKLRVVDIHRMQWNKNTTHHAFDSLEWSSDT